MSDIKAFPMDSRVTEMGEDGLPVYDRQFGSSDLREVMKTYFGDGYFAEVGTSMNVKASSGLDVTVQAGKVNMQGTLGYMDEDATVRLSNADKTYTRIDSIVARLDLSIDKRSIELYAKSGSASSSPTRPSLERTETVWELGLADVTLKAGVTEVTDADITDTRLDADRCGVAEPFAKLDTASLLEQVTAIVTQAQADVKADTDKLEKATGDAVSAMNDALSSTVLGSVWRLQSGSTSDYLAYGDDLNNIASVGTKFCYSASVAGGIANKPTDVTGPFSLATFATEQDPSRLGQVLMTCDASGVGEYTRAGAGSSWTEWMPFSPTLLGTVLTVDGFALSASTASGELSNVLLTAATANCGVGDKVVISRVASNYYATGVVLDSSAPWLRPQHWAFAEKGTESGESFNITSGKHLITIGNTTLLSTTGYAQFFEKQTSGILIKRSGYYRIGYTLTGALNGRFYTYTLTTAGRYLFEASANATSIYNYETVYAGGIAYFEAGENIQFYETWAASGSKLLSGRLTRTEIDWLGPKVG